MGRLAEQKSTVFGQKIRLASRRTGSQGVAHTHSPANQDAEAKKKKTHSQPGQHEQHREIQKGERRECWLIGLLPHLLDFQKN